MRDAGVQWTVFAPMGTLGILRPIQWRRLHRKLVCVDRKVAFCGGINILDDFHDPNHGTLTAPRFDFSVQVTGPLVADVHQAMSLLWSRVDRVAQLKSGRIQQTLRAVLDGSRGSRRALTPTSGQPPDEAQVPSAHESKAALVLRDNVRHRAGIERAYRRAISHARHEVIIANAYFVPGRKLRLALIHAAKRGVKVSLLLQGRYEYFMQFYAARPVYGALLNAGVEIHEYAGSFLHAKVAVIDGTWATVGSSNLDPLSLLLAREANITVQGKAFAADLRHHLMQAIEHEGDTMDPAEYANRPWRQRCLEYIAYMVMRAALMLQGRKYL
jgi:cardiolipin synthase